MLAPVIAFVIGVIGQRVFFSHEPIPAWFSLSLIIGCLLFAFWNGVQFSYCKCPMCENLFFIRRWFFGNGLALRCLHCRLYVGI